MHPLTRAGIAALALALCAPVSAQSLLQNGEINSDKGASVAGTFTAAGVSTGIRIRGAFNFSLYGTFVATCEVDRSFDGTTWLPLTALGSAISFTGPATEVFSEPESGVLYRVNCTSWTSGTVSYRLSS